VDALSLIHHAGHFPGKTKDTGSRLKAGMTGLAAGMTGLVAGMTGLVAGMTGLVAGMTTLAAGMTVAMPLLFQNPETRNLTTEKRKPRPI